MSDSGDTTGSLGVDEVLRRERAALGLDGPNAAPAALCISGGGIRSATFGLGAIQGLAEHGLLGAFDYMSTVSGGGYIGGWLTAWVHRAKGIEAVIPHLRANAPAPDKDAADPIQHLRDYNSYLSPRSGLFSADLWALIATVLRNMLLNWSVLLPLLMAVLIVPRFYVAILSYPYLVYGGPGFKEACPDYKDPLLNPIGDSWFVGYGLPILIVALYTLSLFNTLRGLPGLGKDSIRSGFVTRILAPLVGAGILFLVWGSLFFSGAHLDGFFTAPSEYIEWLAVPTVAAYVLFVAVNARSAWEQPRVFLGPLPLAVAALSMGTGLAIWVIAVHFLYDLDCNTTLTWATTVTVGPPAILAGYYLGTTMVIGLLSHFMTDDEREWMSRAIAYVLMFCVGWLVLCATVLLMPRLVLNWPVWGPGLLTATGGLTAWLSIIGRSFVANENPGAKGTTGQRLVPALLAKLAPAAFMVLLAVGLSLLTSFCLRLIAGKRGFANGQPVDWRDYGRFLDHSNPWWLAGLAALLALVSLVMARFVNINKFSLNGMYRDRLIRAYLGASNSGRKPNWFTGFCGDDNVNMSALSPSQRPFHVLNLTLNLVAGERLAWQQRMAAPFTVTPLHCGTAELGYRSSAEYCGGISLGTAVSISGAAASPAMGYNTSPVAAFIMTLFNARLGAWLGNPGAVGERTWKHEGPHSAIGLIASEALGLTSDRRDYVYLSDGGHFENLGLYEMVRRRCRLIVVLDSGCDPDFTYVDLGNALRKIRIDMRIPIDFDEASMHALREKKQRWAVARIGYSLVEAGALDGRLIYIKPMLLGNEPPDVLTYAARHDSFPHQTTNDQWFDESQTESYRQMGLFTIAELCRGWSGGSLSSWYKHLAVTKQDREDAPRETLTA